MLQEKRFPRSNRYDPHWIIENQMGLNPLWLTEWICKDLKLTRNMRVLDLGCGKCLSSVFLAREYHAQVWATDLWIGPSENHQRIQKAGLDKRIFPIYADARSLPYAHEYFDVIISVDAYIYFGTDDLYLDYLLRFLKRGGMLAIAVPGFTRAPGKTLPQHLRPFWAQDCWSWHTVDWWRQHWSRTGLVKIRKADVLPQGWKLWLKWKQARQKLGDTSESVQQDIRVLQTDLGKYMGFMRLIAEKK